MVDFLYGVAFTLLLETVVLIFATERLRRKICEELHSSHDFDHGNDCPG